MNCLRASTTCRPRTHACASRSRTPRPWRRIEAPAASHVVRARAPRRARRVRASDGSAEFRRKSFIPKDKFPYRIAAGFEYDCGDFAGVMEKALKAADWIGFEQRKSEAKRRGRLRGRGMATYIEATGAGFAPQDQVEMALERRGRRHHLCADAQPRAEARDGVRAACVARARHSDGEDWPAHPRGRSSTSPATRPAARARARRWGA